MRSVRLFGAPLQLNGFASCQRYCTVSSSGRQLNFAALNRGCHLCSAGRPSRWALAHILVVVYCTRPCTRLRSRPCTRLYAGHLHDRVYVVHGRVHDPYGREHENYTYTAMYTAVYTTRTLPSSRQVHVHVTAVYRSWRVHGRNGCLHRPYTAVFTARTAVYTGCLHTRPCTRRHGRLRGPYTAVYSAVFTARTRGRVRRIHGRVHGPCTWSVHTARTRPRTRAYSRPYGRVQGPHRCTAMYTAVHRPCSSQCTDRVLAVYSDHVHGRVYGP